MSATKISSFEVFTAKLLMKFNWYFLGSA